jgi:hypothetical protein
MTRDLELKADVVTVTFTMSDANHLEVQFIC